MTDIKVENWYSITRNYFAKASNCYTNFKNHPSKVNLDLGSFPFKGSGIASP
jgi:hypothetical protein